MENFPLLEQLRADYQRQEAEIRQPLEWELVRAGSQIQSLRSSIQSLTSTFGSKMVEGIVFKASEAIGMALRKSIKEACQKMEQDDAVVVVQLLASEVKWMNPQSLERKLHDAFIQHTLKDLGVSVNSIMVKERYATVLEIRIPAMGYNHVLEEH